jgi:hypothetical protein
MACRDKGNCRGIVLCHQLHLSFVRRSRHPKEAKDCRVSWILGVPRRLKVGHDLSVVKRRSSHRDIDIRLAHPRRLAPVNRSIVRSDSG